MSSFCSGIQFWVSHCIELPCLLSLLICYSSLVFPCLSCPWYFWKILVRYFVECSSLWVCSDIWWSDWGYDQTNYGCLFGKNTTEVICPSHHTISEGTWCLHDITDDVDLEHLNKVVFAKFLHFHTLFFASDSLNPANPGWLGMRGESFYVYYIGRFVSYPLIYEIYI